jgi:glycosyltransferase involved in cell wall biosynthesis
MKIVHFLPALTKGGAERVAVDLANKAASEGHQVTVLVAFKVDETLLRQKLYADVDVLYITQSPVGRVKLYLIGLGWIYRNKRLLADQDVVHCHLSYAALFGSLFYLGRRFSRRDGPVIVETYHAVGMPIPRWHLWLHSRLALCRDGLALMAEDVFWTEFKSSHPKLPVRIIPNGVDASTNPSPMNSQRDYRAKVGVPETCRMIVGTVGQLRPERKPILIVEVFAQMAKRLPSDVHFLLVGDGAEMVNVRAAIKRNGLEERIHTPGIALIPKDPMSVIDLYVTLNVGPITGIAALEAAFLRTPLIAYQLLPDYQPRQDDWIASFHDVQALVDAAVHLVEDTSQRDETAQRQYNHVTANHSNDVMYNSYLKFYANLGAPL